MSIHPTQLSRNFSRRMAKPGQYPIAAKLRDPSWQGSDD
jgi:hypothetical protein